MGLLGFRIIKHVTARNRKLDNPAWIVMLGYLNQCMVLYTRSLFGKGL